MNARLFAATGALPGPFTVASYDFLASSRLPCASSSIPTIVRAPTADGSRLAMPSNSARASSMPPLLHVELRQHGVARRKPGIHGHRATKRLLYLGLVARGAVRARQQRQQRRAGWLLGDFGSSRAIARAGFFACQVEIGEPAQCLEEARRKLERPLERAPRRCGVLSACLERSVHGVHDGGVRRSLEQFSDFGFRARQISGGDQASRQRHAGSALEGSV